MEESASFIDRMLSDKSVIKSDPYVLSLAGKYTSILNPTNDMLKHGDIVYRHKKVRSPDNNTDEIGSLNEAIVGNLIYIYIDSKIHELTGLTLPQYLNLTKEELNVLNVSIERIVRVQRTRENELRAAEAAATANQNKKGMVRNG